MYQIKIELVQLYKNALPDWHRKQLAGKFTELVKEMLDYTIAGVSKTTYEYDIDYDITYIKIDLTRYMMKPIPQEYLDSLYRNLSLNISSAFINTNRSKLKSITINFIKDSWDEYMDKIDAQNENERPFYEGEGIQKVMKKKYKCSECKAKNVKLWRDYGCSMPDLYCVDCAEKSQGKKFKDPNAPHWEQNRDSIGSLCPAVPTSDDTYWGYTSVPSVGCKWWWDLPLRKENK